MEVMEILTTLGITVQPEDMDKPLALSFVLEDGEVKLEDKQDALDRLAEAGLELEELMAMDEDEREDVLEEHGLDENDFDLACYGI